MVITKYQDIDLITIMNLEKENKGAIIFLPGGGHMSVIAGHQLFLVPKKFWSPPPQTDGPPPGKK